MSSNDDVIMEAVKKKQVDRSPSAASSVHSPWTSMFVISLAFFCLNILVSSCAATKDTSLVFELRQQHAATYDGQVVFANIPSSRAPSLAQDNTQAPYNLDVVPVKSYRVPQGISPISLSSRRRQRAKSQPKVAFTPQSVSEPQQSFPEDNWDWWDTDEILGPDISKRNTLLLLAKMTNNAYLEPDEAGWYDLGSDWTVVRTIMPFSCRTR
jgi:lipase ATG15